MMSWFPAGTKRKTWADCSNIGSLSGLADADQSTAMMVFIKEF
jgi:hypothetical protein